MIERCNGCGRRDEATVQYQCSWPDGKKTLERYCQTCEFTWHRQLKALGAQLKRMTANPAPVLKLEDPSETS
jgi:hypothetical protein